MQTCYFIENKDRNLNVFMIFYNGSVWNSFKNEKGIPEYYALQIKNKKQQSHSFQINIMNWIIVHL